MYATGCEVCGEHAASVTTAGMCVCSQCAGAGSHATGVLPEVLALQSLGLDPYSLGQRIGKSGIQGTTDTLIRKPITEIGDTVKVVFIAGSVAVIAFVAYELFKKKPRGEA